MTTNSNKLIQFSNLSAYNTELYGRIGKQWDFTVTLSSQTNVADGNYQALLRLNGNPSHYKFVICKEVMGKHYISEVSIVGNIASLGQHTGYAVNSDEFYIGWGENSKGGKWAAYLAVKAKGEEPILIKYYIKVLFDAAYTTKWQHSCYVPETATFVGNTYPSFNIPNIATKIIEDYIDEQSPLTEIVTTENGKGNPTGGAYNDYIINNTEDDATDLVLTTQGVIPNGVYRFAIKKGVNSVTLNNGDTTTVYDATNIVDNSILTYTKITDSEGNITTNFEYSKPDIYSPDKSIIVNNTAEGKTELSANINSITKCLIINDDNWIDYGRTKFTIPTDVTHIHFDFPPGDGKQIDGVWAKDGQKFKNGQRLTISGRVRFAEGSTYTNGNQKCFNFSQYYYQHVNICARVDRYDPWVQYTYWVKSSFANHNKTYAEFRSELADNREREDEYKALVESIPMDTSMNNTNVYTTYDHLDEAFEEFIYWNGVWYDRGYIDPYGSTSSSNQYVALDNATITTDKDGYYVALPDLGYPDKTTIVDVGTFNNLIYKINSMISYQNSLQAQINGLISRIDQISADIYWDEDKTVDLDFTEGTLSPTD